MYLRILEIGDGTVDEDPAVLLVPLYRVQPPAFLWMEKKVEGTLEWDLSPPFFVKRTRLISFIP
jgi:hypothetical protein